MAPLLLAVVLGMSFMCLVHARCRCFSEEVKGMSAPRAKCTLPPYNQSLTQMYEFPDHDDNVEYSMTFLCDDVMEMYVDGQLIMTEDVAPKLRHQFQYKGPCKDIMAYVVNKSPNNVSYGGVGLGFLITYKNKVYGTAAMNTYQACAPPLCSDPSAVNVKPIHGIGISNPKKDCFTNPKGCDFNEWHPVTVHDTLFDYPLCEFVDMGRHGGIPVNPVDGHVPDMLTFGMRFHLPFCS